LFEAIENDDVEEAIAIIAKEKHLINESNEVIFILFFLYQFFVF
jgi:hypothetical protein